MVEHSYTETKGSDLYELMPDAKRNDVRDEISRGS